MEPTNFNFMYFRTNVWSNPEGFTPVTADPADGLYQCLMCFGLVVARCPHNMPYQIDALQHHRDNCYGWQKGK